jgi:hypothetical protein
MNVTEKRSLAEKVRVRFTRLMASAQFARSKPTFWVRPQGDTVEFVHLHLFSFTSAFRAHLGIRVLNDPFDAAALNGPNTDQFREYKTDFTALPGSLDECAAELQRFCVEVGEPWFRRWRDPIVLGEAKDSPLSREAVAALRAAARGERDGVAISRSEYVLGLRQP